MDTIPARDDARYWKETRGGFSVNVLSTGGISLLRDAIREEKKRRREGTIAMIDAGAKIATILTGLGGVAIGILTLLNKKG